METKKAGYIGCLIGAGILAVVVVPLWFFFIGPMLRHDRLVEKGVHVPGRLLSVDETGTYVNDAPELELIIEYTRKDGMLDTSTCDFVPTIRTVHFYQPGTAVTAAYDPEDPDEITIVSLNTASPGVGSTGTASEIIDKSKRMMDSIQQRLDSISNELTKKMKQ